LYNLENGEFLTCGDCIDHWSIIQQFVNNKKYKTGDISDKMLALCNFYVTTLFGESIPQATRKGGGYIGIGVLALMNLSGVGIGLNNYVQFFNSAEQASQPEHFPTLETGFITPFVQYHRDPFETNEMGEPLLPDQPIIYNVYAMNAVATRSLDQIVGDVSALARDLIAVGDLFRILHPEKDARMSNMTLDYTVENKERHSVFLSTSELNIYPTAEPLVLDGNLGYPVPLRDYFSGLLVVQAQDAIIIRNMVMFILLPSVPNEAVKALIDRPESRSSLISRTVSPST